MLRTFTVGKVFDVVDMSVTHKTNSNEERYDPFTTSTVKMKFIQGRSRMEQVPDCSGTLELLAALADPLPAPGLEQHSLLEVREPRLRGLFCNILACVRFVGEVKVANGRPVREVRLADQTSDTGVLKLWEPEQIRLAGGWIPRNTVVFLANMLVEFDPYRGINVLAGSSRSVLTEQPSLWNTGTVRDHVRSISFSPIDRLSTFVAGSSAKPLTRLLTVEGLRQLIGVGRVSDSSSLVFVNIVAGFSETNLDSETSTALQCCGCRGPVTALQEGLTVCEQFDCPGSQGSTEPAHVHFTVTADVTDQTGTLENLEVHELFLESACGEARAWEGVSRVVRSTTRRLFLTIFKLITVAVELPLKSHATPPRMIVVSAEE